MIELKEIFKKKEQHTKKQHFIPQTYIKQFYNDEEKVWRCHVTYKNTKELTSAQIFYGIKQYDLKYKNKVFRDIEKNYSDLENNLAKIYESMKVTNYIKVMNENKETNEEMFFIFKVAIIFQYFRNIHHDYKSFIGHCSNLTGLYEDRRDYFTKHFSFIDMKDLKYLQRKVRNAIKKDKEALEALVKGVQYIMLPILLTNFYSERLRMKKFSDKCLISSDQPVVCKNKDDIYQFKNFVYPLTPDTIIYSLGEDVTEDMINDHNKINKFILENSVEYVITHDKKIIEQYI